jgi:hypothetical protein
VLEAPGSSLPVTGGRSVANIPRTRCEDLFSVESAKTFAEGLFEDRDRFREYTHRRVEQDTLVASTRVYADVKGLSIGRTPRMTIARLRADFGARSPLGSGQPTITVADVKADGKHASKDDGKEGGVSIEGVEIDGHTLIVELNVEPFQRLNTHAKLLAAADEPEFVKASGDALLMRTARHGEAAPPPAGRLMQASYGTLYTTIVKSIYWQGRPFPESEIRGHKVILPKFGRVYFGELLISESSRRLTMVRWALGSDAGGDAAAADVQDNGGWSWSP